MRKTFLEPELEVVRFGTEDIITTSFVNDLLVGLQGNISSKYKKSREDIAMICEEFLNKVEQYDE